MKFVAHPTHQTLPQCATVTADTEKDSLMAIHTAAVAKAKRAMRDNRVLGDHPPPISSKQTNLRRPQRTTLSQLRSRH